MSKQFTLIFPGQGSQKVGMGAHLIENFPIAKTCFEQANSVLKRDITSLILQGPEDDLKQTQNTQPALFTVEAAISQILSEKGINPTLTAGHSLGEYGALYAAGVFSFADGLKLVAKRGELMSAAGTKRPGTMAAVIGMSVEQIQTVLSSLNAGIVVTANQNSPGQTVISGEIGAVNKACEALKAAGAKRALPLPVSGAFHSPLMQEVANEFEAFLATIPFNTPTCPVIANVTAKAETDPIQLKNLLTKQLVSPVRWVETVGVIAAMEHGTIIEAGPGTVLSGLVKQCVATLNVVPCGTAENIYSLAS